MTKQPSSTDEKLVSEVEQMLSVLGTSPSVENVRMPGSRIGKYAIERVLHCHGQAVVALAHDPDLDRQVILKLYHAAETDAQRARLINEGRALARIQSPHVATVFAVEAFEDYVFLVIDYVPGLSLRELLNQQRESDGVTVDQSLRVVREVAEGLDKVHKLGLLHRDLKPANVMISPEGDVKLIDFGLVSLVDSKATYDRSGTPAYMAPECARGQDDTVVDQRSDVFGVGALLYDMISGQPPFSAESSSASRDLAIAGEVTPVRELNPEVPTAVADLCMRCLSEDPQDRFGSAQELIGAIDEVLPTVETSRRRWPIVLAGIGLLTVAVLLLLTAWLSGAFTPFSRPAKLRDVYTSPLIENEEWIRFRNHEVVDHYMRDNEQSNAALSLQLDDRSVWQVEMHVEGAAFRNKETGRYLMAEEWDAFTAPSLEDGGYWLIEEGKDGLVSVRSVSTNRYLDGDFAVDSYDVDLSEAVKDDDLWSIERE